MLQCDREAKSLLETHSDAFPSGMSRIIKVKCLCRDKNSLIIEISVRSVILVNNNNDDDNQMVKNK